MPKPKPRRRHPEPVAPPPCPAFDRDGPSRSGAVAAGALALALAGCPKAEPPIAAVTLPAVATSSVSLAPWAGHLASMTGRAPGAEPPATPLVDRAADDAPTVYAFWATYCPPCLAEMPMFEALHAAGRRVVGVSLDAGADDEVRELLAQRGVSYPNVLLDEASMKAAGRALPSGLPFTLVLDTARRPRVALFGKTDRAELDAALRIVAP